jgi:hypothetical protein
MKVKAKAYSVAGERIRMKIKPNMTEAQIAQIEAEANHRSLVDVFGENFQVDSQGNPIEQGRYSSTWLATHTDAECEPHLAALERYAGPQAAKNERERIHRLRANKK